MIDEPRIWRNAENVTALAHGWDRRLSGHKIDRLGGGPGWLRLSLVNEREDTSPPVHLFLIARPGAILCWDDDHSPPPVVLDTLGRIRQKQLTITPHLLGATLEQVGTPPEDRILCLNLRTSTGRHLQLLQQLFAQRGNLVLLDADGRRLWAAHAFPHQILLNPVTSFAPAPPSENLDVMANQARELGPALLVARLVAQQRNNAETMLRRRHATLERLRNRLAEDLANAERGDLWRRYAETLAIHLHSLKKGHTEAVLTAADGSEVRIPLDPALPPHRNMERWFKRAGKAERGRETIAKRLQDTEGRLKLLLVARDDLDAINDENATALESLIDWRDQHTSMLVTRKKSRKAAGAEDVQASFRRYVVAGRWEVWVGRSSVENDELTHRASSPQDWWFHAQGVPGSHVILRTGGRPEQVPKFILGHVASIAAWYSKARNSGLVPVIYTLRKYVRKPRKSLPGTASCINEKSLMVEPGLPSGEKDPKSL